MHKKYSTFLIFAFIAVSIFGIYSYFYNDLKSEAAASAVEEDEDALTSSLGSVNTAVEPTSGSKASEDTAFLAKLNSIKNIKIDVSLFTDQTFMLLVDNNVVLGEAPFGRVNPFSPLNNLPKVEAPAEITTIIKTN